jgi:hypothetical protein
VNPEEAAARADAARAYSFWTPIGTIALAVLAVAIVALVAVIIWKKGWQVERGAATGREIGRQVGEAMAQHFGERLHWIEVRLGEVLGKLTVIMARSGIVEVPSYRPPQASRPDPEEQDPRARQTVVPSEPPRRRLRSYASIVDEEERGNGGR